MSDYFKGQALIQMGGIDMKNHKFAEAKVKYEAAQKMKLPPWANKRIEQSLKKIAIMLPEATPEATPEAMTPEANSISGLIAGDASVVRAVLLHGPDNVIREAARVVPHEGRWVARDLRPGRYRVQLDGGNDRVLVSDPAYQLIELAEGESVTADEFRVVSSVEPADRR